MSDYNRLTGEKKAAFLQFLHFFHKRQEINLRHLAASAKIVVADAIAGTLSDDKYSDLRLKSGLLARKSEAMETLSNQGGAYQWATYKMYTAFKKMNGDDDE